MQKSVKIPTVAEALRKLSARCAVSEQAPADLLRKMRGWGMSETDVAAVMERLVNGNFVNEERYARAFVNDKFIYARWGRVKIAQGLRQKGIAPSLVQAVVSEIDETEYRQFLCELLEKQLPAVRARNVYERRAKLARFAVGRGFEQYLVFECLDTLVDEPDELD